MPLPIVLLPGLDGTGELFEPLVSAAPPQFEPIVVRLPELSTYDELMAHVCERLPKYGQFVVLGESFSGPLALRVARAEPRRVRALILCNSFVRAPITRLLRFAPWSLLMAMTPPRWVIRQFFVGSGAAKEIVDAVHDAIAKTPKRVLGGRMREVFSLCGDDEPLNVPVLSLTGANDRMVMQNARALMRLAPHAVHKRIAAPHLLLQVAPKEAWNEIASFLET